MRVIDIPQKLTDYLKAEKYESIYVCIDSKNAMHAESSWKRMWESYLCDLNLKYGTFAGGAKSKFDLLKAAMIYKNSSQ